MSKYTSDQGNLDLFDVFNVAQFDDFYGKALSDLKSDFVIVCAHVLDYAVKMLEPEIRKSIDAYNRMQPVRKSASLTHRKMKSEKVDPVRLCLVQICLSISDYSAMEERIVRYAIMVRRAVGWLTLSTPPDCKTIWKDLKLFNKCDLFPYFSLISIPPRLMHA